MKTITTIDHQQAAVRAVADALHGDACPADPDPGESCVCGDYEREAEIALTAAAPHLRAAWAAELGATFQSGERWNETYRKGLRTLQYEKAYLDGAIDILALLEGGAE